MLKNGSRKRTDINLPTVEGEIKKLLAFPDSITILPHGVPLWGASPGKEVNFAGHGDFLSFQGRQRRPRLPAWPARGGFVFSVTYPWGSSAPSAFPSTGSGLRLPPRISHEKDGGLPPALLNFPKGTLFNRASHFRKTPCPSGVRHANGYAMQMGTPCKWVRHANGLVLLAVNG